MNRASATSLLRDTLDTNGLKDWHIRLVSDLTKPFLGMCSYKDKCIILNSFHVDTHGDLEVISTIKHEVAHALTPNCGHNETWVAKAKELGCDNTSPCATYSFDERAIDAIRSGADLEVTYEERVVREPKYKVTRLQDKCEKCGKVAKELSRRELKTPSGYKWLIKLECGHYQIKNSDSKSPFEDFVFDGDDACKHVWGEGRDRTTCQKCGAHKLYEYQVLGARALEKANGRFALLDEPGLGKTIQAGAYIHYNIDECRPFLWVTRAGVKYQHLKELVRLLGWKHFPQVITGGKDKLIKGMNTIISYDAFRRMDLEMFIKHEYKLLVLDECQAIKNPDSARTQCIRQIAKHIPKIIPMSGTFWKNRGSEAFVMYNMLDPKLFYSFQHFKDTEVEFFWKGSKLVEGGFRNPVRMREKTAHICIRRERKDAMPELPLINRTRFVCEVPEHARSVYNDARDQLIKDYNDAVISGEEDSFATHQKLMQSLIIMRQVLGIAKVPATVEFAKEFLEDSGRKLVIFVHHKKCGELIYNQLVEWCNAESMPQVLRLSADMDAMSRSEVQNKFNSNGTRVLVASTLASGEGLNLQSCSDCIMHERQWNPANEEQAEGRFIRIGQESDTVNATYIHADNSIDTDLDGIVENKRRAFHAAMNTGVAPQWNEQSVVKDLAAMIAGQER